RYTSINIISHNSHHIKPTAQPNNTKQFTDQLNTFTSHHIIYQFSSQNSSNTTYTHTHT
ncbi:hypothetical protein LINPERHAP1_LOCUS12871, partial [Linum perenne]